MSPTIATFCGDTGVTGLTQRHEVIRIVRTTAGERENMVDFLGRRQLALLLTLLTERVRFDVAVADTLPASTVAFVGLWVPLILVVLFVHDLLVFGAVLLAYGKPTAAGVGAGTLRFIGHLLTSSRAYKNHRRISPVVAVFYSVSLQ